MLELKMTLEGDQEKAFRYMVAQINANSAIAYDEQEIFRQQAVYYIKRALEDYIPLALSDEVLEGLTDEQQLELQSKAITQWSSFLKSIPLGTVPSPGVFRQFLNWIMAK